jgi:hypothetical protein
MGVFPAGFLCHERRGQAAILEHGAIPAQPVIHALAFTDQTLPLGDDARAGQPKTSERAVPQKTSQHVASAPFM